MSPGAMEPCPGLIFLGEAVASGLGPCWLPEGGMNNTKTGIGQAAGTVLGEGETRGAAVWGSREVTQSPRHVGMKRSRLLPGLREAAV